jgi:Rrf2 family nitric oxide-sensitive transcriptional repressor
MGILSEAQTALFDVLDKYTLADLLKKEDSLARILIYPRAGMTPKQSSSNI